MEIPNEALLLRIFVGEDDRDDDRPLYEAIVLRARELHLAGATVLRGAMGFGHSSRLHTTKILRLSEDLPRSEEHTSELQSLMRISYAVFGLNKKKTQQTT